MITKTFEHKGQMINYYNKAKNNPAIDFIIAGYLTGVGYVVQYIYKNKR